MNQRWLLWFTEINCIIHIILQIHGQMSVEVSGLTKLCLIVILQTGDTSIIGGCTILICRLIRFIGNISFSAEPMSWICQLFFCSTAKTKYWNEIVASCGETAIRLIEFTVAHNDLWEEKNEKIRNNNLLANKLWNFGIQCAWPCRKQWPKWKEVWIDQPHGTWKIF